MKITPLLGGSMSGSVGGLTASRNSSGLYFRARAVPVQPGTARQMAIKSAFAALVNQWANVLTPTQRAAWDTYASATPRVDSLGQSYTISGQNAYLGANTLRLQAADANPTGSWVLRSDAPLSNTSGVPITDATIITDPGGPSISLETQIAGGASTDAGILLFVGPAQNPGRSYYKGPYRLAVATSSGEVGAGDTTHTLTLNAAATTYAGPYGPIAAGTYVPIRVVLAYDDGRHALAYQALLTVEEG